METNEVIKKSEEEVKEISNTLHIVLPFGNIPLPIKLIAFLTSIGGLSIVASIFADILNPFVIFYLYILRIITGVAMLAVGYGLIKKKEWSMWLYGSISILSLFINLELALIPIFITGYLYYKRNYFEGGSPREVYAAAKKFWEENKPHNKTNTSV